MVKDQRKRLRSRSRSPFGVTKRSTNNSFATPVKRQRHQTMRFHRPFEIEEPVEKEIFIRSQISENEMVCQRGTEGCLSLSLDRFNAIGITVPSSCTAINKVATTLASISNCTKTLASISNCTNIWAPTSPITVLANHSIASSVKCQGPDLANNRAKPL